MTLDLRRSLAGISGILVTPFNVRGEIASARQKPIVDGAIGAGIHNLTANGNTGEFYSLTAVEASVDHIADRIPLIAGVGRSIRDACRLAEASALMIHQPQDPFVTPEGLVEYIRAVHEAEQGLPMILYLRLPPYSPELNPVETLFSVLKHRRFANRVFESAEHVRKTVTEVWDTFSRNADEISQITRRKWASI